FVGEKHIDPNDLGWMSGTRATLRNTGTPLNTALPAALVAALAGTAEAPASETTPAPNNDSSAPSTAAPAETTAADSSIATSTPAIPSDPTLYVGGFASSHTGGVNFLLGDGSVRFVSELINFQVLQQLANRSDGKLMPATF
ncbi:MAG TPA: H-X9-DG-CTERM domain-containing protein, partial [Pirellulales bacterium]